jgi:serine-type D-Ala-D-Ala carboxypeptidase
MDFSPVESAFSAAVDQGIFPGAVVLAAKDDCVVFERAFGFRSLVPEKTSLELSTVFDLASLTKPLATTAALMMLVGEGKIRIDDPVTRFLPGFGMHGKGGTTIRQLLTHSSGLPAWKPYYQDVVREERAGNAHVLGSRGAKSYVLQLVYNEKPLHVSGKHCLYSDLGFMVLGALVETASGMTLDRFCCERVYTPLGLRATGFFDLTQTKTRGPGAPGRTIAPTEQCPWRKKILCGEVHDDNAYAMGGVAGHAGLFGSAQELHGLLACLSRCLHGHDKFLPQSVLEEFFTKDTVAVNSTFALGWDTPSPRRSASGSLFSPRTIGHLGFTGTSVWWDLEKNCYIILLTNRVHPSRKNERILDFRPHIHDLMMKAMFP